MLLINGHLQMTDGLPDVIAGCPYAVAERPRAAAGQYFYASVHKRN